MPLPVFLKALDTLRALELAAAEGDRRAAAFLPAFAAWLAGNDPSIAAPAQIGGSR